VLVAGPQTSKQPNSDKPESQTQILNCFNFRENFSMWSSEQIVGSFVSYKSCVLGIFICGVLLLTALCFWDYLIISVW
jgi:hypothetical protein